MFASLTGDAKPGKPKARKGRAARPKTSIPDSFEITPKMRAWAADKCPDVDIDLHTIRFINWHTEQQTLAALWDRAWQNWMAKEQAMIASRRPRASPAAENISARYTPAPTLTRPDWNDQ